jgi:carbonic anhydrase
MMVVGCVDLRVDPAHVLGLANGEAAIIRNVGGRITPATLRTLSSWARSAKPTPTHTYPAHGTSSSCTTDCGMTDLAPYPGLLAEYFEISEDELAGKSVSDPVGSVRVDVEAIWENMHGSDFLVSGLVYDVATGHLDVVVAPTPLHPS